MLDPNDYTGLSMNHTFLLEHFRLISHSFIKLLVKLEFFWGIRSSVRTFNQFLLEAITFSIR